MQKAGGRVSRRAAKKEDLVVVLHGLGNSKRLMSALCWYLRARGFKVLNIGYPSCRHDCAKLSSYIQELIQEEWNKGTYRSIHFVGFSLGSQLARILVEKNADKLNGSRMVMIGPPNQGSSIARTLRNVLPTSKIWGPVFDELCQHNLPNPAQKVEVGIIAGGLGHRMGINPFLKNDNDGLVTIEEPFLEGAKDHRQIFAVHGTMPIQPRVLKMTAKFLETGHF